MSRLVGAPPGYVGYDEGGQLTEAVRRRPYSVVLLDEIEKAHPDVFNVLLQVMDDGRLTDGQGRTVDFKNTVLIMTSNVAGGMRGRRGHLQARVHQPPRRDRRVRPADPRRRSGRSSRSRSRSSSSGVRERGIEVELTDDARTLIGNLGYDPTYGARPAQARDPEAAGRQAGAGAARGRVRATATPCCVDAADGELVFAKARPRAEPVAVQAVGAPRMRAAAKHRATSPRPAAGMALRGAEFRLAPGRAARGLRSATTLTRPASTWSVTRALGAPGCRSAWDLIAHRIRRSARGCARCSSSTSRALSAGVDFWPTVRQRGRALPRPAARP